MFILKGVEKIDHLTWVTIDKFNLMLKFNDNRLKFLYVKKRHVMKNAIIITFLVLFSLHGFGQGTNTTPTPYGPVDENGAFIDPLDNYVDPATNLEYGKQLALLNDDQVQIVFERCMMFTIQNEMGQSGEASMSDADIEAYEELVSNRCKCIADNGTWEAESESKGECKADVPAVKDILIHTMDMCVDRMQLSDESCKNEMTPTCKNDFRYQCYQYMTQPQEYSEKANPILNACEYDDQTKNIKMECRSYCYVRKTCEVTEEDFKNRTIGNVYLLKKKSRSSCVKGSTYGIDSKNQIWVNNSCHGEFAIQYKDPKCGFRPTCVPQAHITDHIADGGTQTFVMACDGERAETEGGKFFCKATAMMEDQSNKVTDEPDPGKEITRVTNIVLDKKVGAAACNPGGNSSPIDYSPRNKGLDGGWGIEVQRKCHASFKVTVKWKKKLCTMAGEEGVSKDTCCNGLYFDPKKKTCNVPQYYPEPLEDEVKLALDYGTTQQNKCSPKFTDDANSVVAKYFVELGYYENMFSLIDAKSDGVSSILYPGIYNEQKDKFEAFIQTMNEEIQVAKDASIVAKQAAFELTDEEEKAEAFQKIADELSVAMKLARDKEEVARNELEGTLVGDKSSLPKDSTYDSTNLIHDAIVRFRTDWASQTIEFNIAANHLKAQSSQHTEYLDSVDKKTVTEEATLAMKTNLFDGLDVQAAALEYQKVTKQVEIAYMLAMGNLVDQYVLDIEAAAIVGQNVAWLCAHKENCSEYNWLIRDKSKDEVVDFLHDAPHPFKLVQARGRMLPKITKVNKLLIDTDKYERFESGTGEKKGLGLLEELKQFYSYQTQETTPFPEPAIEGDESASKDADRVLNLFRQYTQEFPIRENSLQKDNDYLTKYLDPEKGKSSGLPEFCPVQNEYAVRVPMGKAIEPLRMLQMLKVIKKYYSLYAEAYVANEECLSALDDANPSNTTRPDLVLNNTGLGAGGSGGGSGVSADERNFMNGLGGSIIGQLGSTFDDAAPGSFLDNLKNRALGENNLSSTGDNLSAVQKEKDRVAKLIKKRIKRKGDKRIADYMKSLDKSLGATLSKKANQFASLSNPATGFTGLLKGGTNNSAVSGFGRDSKKTGLSGGSGKGNGYSSRRKLNYGNKGKSSSYGMRKGGASGGSRGNGNGNSGMLSGVNDKKFDSNEADTLFEMVTKRYIRTAYPVLLEKKTKKEEE